MEMIRGKIYFVKTEKGTPSARINITGNLSELNLKPGDDLFVQVSEDGRRLTIVPMDDIKI